MLSSMLILNWLQHSWGQEPAWGQNSSWHSARTAASPAAPASLPPATGNDTASLLPTPPHTAASASHGSSCFWAEHGPFSPCFQALPCPALDKHCAGQARDKSVQGSPQVLFSHGHSCRQGRQGGWKAYYRHTAFHPAPSKNQMCSQSEQKKASRALLQDEAGSEGILKPVPPTCKSQIKGMPCYGVSALCASVLAPPPCSPRPGILGGLQRHHPESTWGR